MSDPKGFFLFYEKAMARPLRKIGKELPMALMVCRKIFSVRRSCGGTFLELQIVFADHVVYAARRDSQKPGGLGLIALSGVERSF